MKSLHKITLRDNHYRVQIPKGSKVIALTVEHCTPIVWVEMHDVKDIAFNGQIWEVIFHTLYFSSPSIDVTGYTYIGHYVEHNTRSTLFVYMEGSLN